MKSKILFLALFLLVPIARAHYTTYDNLGVRLMFDREPPFVGELSRMHISLQDEFSRPITELDLVHEREMHVLIVGSDLSLDTFFHTHPDDFPNGFENRNQGIYSLNQRFPKGGDYAIIVDYTAKGVNYMNLFKVNVDGGNFMAAPNFDFARNGMFQGYNVTLKAPENIFFGEEMEFTYHIAKDGKDVGNLGLYLGAEMHILAINENRDEYDHTHPYIPGHYIHAGAMPQRYSGPTVPVHLTFKKPGKYALFGQFLHNGKVVNTRFTVEVHNPDTFIKKSAFAGKLFFGIIMMVIIIVSLYIYKKSIKK